MANIWISPVFMWRYIAWYKKQDSKDQAVSALREVVQAAVNPEWSDIDNLPKISTAYALSKRIEWKTSYLDVAESVIIYDFRDTQDIEIPLIENDVRAVFLPSDVAEEWLSYTQNWASYSKGICDVADIDRSKKRPGLNFKTFGIVSSIFLSQENRRVHFLDSTKLTESAEPKNSKNAGKQETSKPSSGERFAVILGDFDSLLWQSHSGVFHKIDQPRGTQVDAWTKAHNKILQRYEKHLSRLSWLLSPYSPKLHIDDVVETWVSKEQLEEIGITNPVLVQEVMVCNTDNDLIQLINVLPENEWGMIVAIRERHLLQQRRKEERAIGSIAQYELNSGAYTSENRGNYENWLSILSPTQKEVVTAPVSRPIRLKGGPGTGKTLTSVLRAAALLHQAKQKSEKFRIGYFVFNRDLGRKTFELAVSLGLGEYLDEDSDRQQSLTITSLGKWCEDFLDIDAMGIEPLASYKADRFDQTREALLQLTIEDARKELQGEKYEQLWRQFDFRTQNGLREVETEISQFIKARCIPSLDAYLRERRPAQWLQGSEHEFRSFVWDVYRHYDAMLTKLRMVDADDLVNDSFRRVSQTIWQNFEKEREGFDYLIIDEAHDFFRHHLHLLASILKSDSNVLMTYDQGQMVYSRYPTLREMGHESDERFFSRRLEVNFRSSKQIVAALQTLTAAYPMYDYASMWGKISANPISPEGPLPESQGYQTDTGMQNAVGKLITKYVGTGILPRDIAVIGFSDSELEKVEQVLKQSFDCKTHRLTGEGKRPPKDSVIVASARQVKGV